MQGIKAKSTTEVLGVNQNIYVFKIFIPFIPFIPVKKVFKQRQFNRDKGDAGDKGKINDGSLEGKPKYLRL